MKKVACLITFLGYFLLMPLAPVSVQAEGVCVRQATQDSLLEAWR